MPAEALPAVTNSTGRVKVLIVDDDASVRGFLHRVLKRDFDAEVAETDDGLGALELLHAEAFDLVIVDLNMQVIDGIETLQAIRRTPALRALPVIAISGGADERRTKQLVALNVADIFAKPISSAALLQRLSPVITRLRGRAGPPNVRSRFNLRQWSRILLVGGPDQFRNCLQQHFSPVCEVKTFSSAASALRDALATTPDAVFITGDDFLLPPALLARKLKPEGQAVPKVFLCEPSAAPFSDDVRCFDGRLNKVLTSVELFRELRPLLTNPGLALALLPPRSALLQALWTSAAQTLSASTEQELSFATTMPMWPSDDHRAVEAATDVSVEDVHWQLQVLLTHECGLRYTGSFVQDNDSDLIGEANILKAVRALSERLAMQLRDELLAYDITAAIGASQASMVVGLEQFAETPENTGVVWLVADGHTGFSGALRVVPMNRP